MECVYDGLLRQTLPRSAKLVAYADDVAVVIVMKHLDEINQILTFAQINQWMNTATLRLAEHNRGSANYVQKESRGH